MPSAKYRLCPLVVDAHSSAISSTLRLLLDFIGGSSIATENTTAVTVALRAAQCLSVSLHRDTAQAVLKRIEARLRSGRQIEDEALWLCPQPCATEGLSARVEWETLYFRHGAQIPPENRPELQLRALFQPIWLVLMGSSSSARVEWLALFF
eukprot:405694-Amphidinium_carterae.1